MSTTSNSENIKKSIKQTQFIHIGNAEVDSSFKILLIYKITNQNDR